MNQSTTANYVSENKEVLEREIRRVLALQKTKALAWRSSSADERRQRLIRLRDALMVHRADLHRAGQADFGKPALEVDTGGILPVLAELIWSGAIWSPRCSATAPTTAS